MHRYRESCPRHATGSPATRRGTAPASRLPTTNSAPSGKFGTCSSARSIETSHYDRRTVRSDVGTTSVVSWNSLHWLTLECTTRPGASVFVSLHWDACCTCLDGRAGGIGRSDATPVRSTASSALGKPVEKLFRPVPPDDGGNICVFKHRDPLCHSVNAASPRVNTATSGHTRSHLGK